jgi:exodeoxyribonuclease V alpha subunit
MSEWSVLDALVGKGSLECIDLVFARSALKKEEGAREEHAALLAVLFALLRRGHLVLDVSSQGLQSALQCFEMEDTDSFAALVRKGAETFPPHTWVCRLGFHFYLQKNWVYESEILAHLTRLCGKVSALPYTMNEKLNALQKAAVEGGMENSLFLLTGGPGTGKTFTAVELVKAHLSILSLEQKRHYRIILTAPTGKAVAQLEGNVRKVVDAEVHIQAGTLHAILGIKAHRHDEERPPLFADLVIVDECSMIDAKLFARLLASIASGTQLVLIGDKDQLPPVEMGSIFADLIDSGKFPSVHLTESLRSDRLEILRFASWIKEGKVQEAFSFLLKNTEVAWMDLGEENSRLAQFYQYLWERCQDHFPSPSSEKPDPQQLMNQPSSFSILSCMRQGPLGVDALNNYFLQQSLKQAPLGSWWVAPILVTRNDRELQLFNGDVGFVMRKIGPHFSLRQFELEDSVFFPDRREGHGFRQFPALALGAFEYSYALSVHKSQGSEYDEVLILIPEGSESFGREVLYTAVTRARHKVSLAGSKAVLCHAISTSSRKASGIGCRLNVVN